MKQRPRRNRITPAIRNLVRENNLLAQDFIYPLFVVAGKNIKSEIKSMPGVFRYSLDNLLLQCEVAIASGLDAIVLFPALDESLKDSHATHSYDANGLYPVAIRAIKQEFPDLTLVTDVAMDPYSSDGHDGLVDEQGKIQNDASLKILAKMATVQAQAGADIVAPSDMMDGRVAFIREHLDNSGYTDTGILSYTAKYASSFYGPFREALDSAPKKGDKKTYQMDPANSREALRELMLDIDEGADMVMVKPGLPYLDIIYRISEMSSVPVAAYNVSGEYAMLKAASQNGWLDYKSAVMEAMIAFKRAGADMILSYHALEVAAWLKQDL